MLSTRLIFPPTHDELKSSELDQDEAAENTVDPEAAGTGTLASSATDSSNHDDWVTVEKPPAADESSGTPADSEGKIEGSGTYHEPKATTDPSHASGGSRMQNNLLKDW